MTNAVKLPLTEKIYQWLKQEIFSFRFLPGDRFSENQIAKQVNASRTPVREALYRLEREGFVQVCFRSGWQIKPFDFQQFEQLYDVRIILEKAAIEVLCQLNPPPNLQDLTAIWCVEPNQQLTDEHQVCALDEAFHTALITRTGNTELEKIYTDITQRLRIIRRIDFTQPERIHHTYNEHATLLRTIIAQNASSATAQLQSHIQSSKAAVRKITYYKLHEAKINKKLI